MDGIQVCFLGALSQVYLAGRSAVFSLNAQLQVLLGGRRNDLTQQFSELGSVLSFFPSSLLIVQTDFRITFTMCNARKKQASQTSGYEIVYTADASFGKKNTKTAVIKSNKTTVKEIKGLKPGKKYYVKVRTYKEVKSGTKKVRIYSDWSKKKAVQIKK